MPLEPGTRLGPYEIVAPLGAGGMGEVYRARDSRLAREVAIKVLPQHLSENPEVRARFEREAKTVSSLNHPNICTLFDVGRDGSTDYLVMELVDGETLAQRLTRGPLPPAEVLRLGIQIADALDRAHRAGVIHRDLKPGNVMLARSGAKLMDFGLARATGLAGRTGGSGATLAALTQSPTVAQPLTAEGTLVGTFQYMAPEQLEGREADMRTDLWALGAVLYEMATGRPAFEGRSQASLIAAILEREPAPLGQVAPLSPPALDRLIRACLAKDPDQRLQTAHDAKLQLQWIAEGGSQAGVPVPVALRRRSRERLAWALAAVAILAAAGFAAAWIARRPAAPAVVQFEVRPPAGARGVLWPRLSPDGRMLALLVLDSTGSRRLWVRPFDQMEGHVVGDVEGVARPFWSPDGRALAYISDGKLKRVSITGGAAVTIGDIGGGSDGSWGSTGLILFDSSITDSLRVVPASGGVPKPACTIDRAHGEVGAAWPFFLPDGTHFLFVGSHPSEPGGSIHFARIGSLESRVVGRTDGRVEYAGGYLVFTNGGTLFAQPFDPRAGRTTGDPVPIGDQVAMGADLGSFSASAGALVYRPQSSGGNSRLVWMDRGGREVGQVGAPADYNDVTLSPDGSRIALSIGSGSPMHTDIWVHDLRRGVTSRLSFEPGDQIWPVWSPDGSRIAYAANHAGEYSVYVRAANGTGGVDSLVHLAGGNEGPSDWSRDGRMLLVNRYANSQWDVYLQAPTPGAKETPLLQNPFSERFAHFSPDGRWIAYTSNETGRPEVFVLSATGAPGKWQVSTNGGTVPYWRADGRELYYRAADRALMAVPIGAGASFEPGTPVRLFVLEINEGGPIGWRWWPAADGQRFLVNAPLAGNADARFLVTTNALETLARRK